MQHPPHHPATTALLLLALVTLTACRTGPDLRPDPRPTSAPLDAMLRRLPPDPALTLALFPDRLIQSADTLALALSAFGAEGLAPSITSLGGLQGLDRARPIVLAGFSPPDPALFESATRGNILDLEEAPLFLHGRLVIPATDPGLLLASAMALASELNLDMLPVSGPWLDIAPKGVLLVGGDLLAAIIPEPDALRVEIALTRRDLAAVSEPLAAIAREKPSPNDRQSPAWTHFLEGDGVASAHVDLGAWAVMDAAYELTTIRDVLSVVPDDQRPEFLARATALSLSAALATAPHQRRTRDLSLSLSIADTLDLRLTRTLTDDAPEASGPQHTFAARSDAPTAEVQLKAISPEALNAASRRPGPLQIIELGHITKLYILFNDPTVFFSALSAERFGDDPPPLPSALSIAVEKLEHGPEGAPEPVLALAMTFQRDDAQRAAASLKALSPDEGGPTIDVRPLDGEGALVIVAFGAPPDALLDLEAPLSSPLDLRVRLDLARLLPLVFGPSLNPQAMSALGTLEIADATLGACHTASLRLGPASMKEALIPTLIQTPRTPPRAQPTEGDLCLSEAPYILQELIEINTLPADQRTQRVAAAAQRLEAQLQCARDHDRRAEADLIEAGWRLWSARLHAVRRDEDSAIKDAAAACALGRDVACQLKTLLTPPYPEGALRLPKIAWGKATLPLDHDARLSISQEAIYLDKQRLADLQRLDASPEPSTPWLAMALAGARPHRDSDDAWRMGVKPRLEVLIDADTPYSRVRKALRAADDAGFESQIVLRGLDDHTRAFRPLLAAALPDPMPKEETTDQDTHDAWLTIDRAAATLRHQGAEAAAINLQPDSADPTEALVTLSRACQAVQVRIGGPPIYHVVIAPDVPFQEAMRVLGALGVPPGVILDTPEVFNALIDGYNPFDAGFAPHTVILDDPEPPSKPAKDASAMNQPTILDRSAVVVGAIDKEDIREVMRRAQPTIRFCYEKSLINDPKLEGRATVKFTIGADGSVVSAAIEGSDLGDGPLEQCLTRAIMRLKFPSPRGGGMVIVSYPFNFSSAK